MYRFLLASLLLLAFASFLLLTNSSVTHAQATGGGDGVGGNPPTPIPAPVQPPVQKNCHPTYQKLEIVPIEDRYGHKMGVATLWLETCSQKTHVEVQALRSHYFIAATIIDTSRDISMTSTGGRKDSVVNSPSIAYESGFHISGTGEITALYPKLSEDEYAGVYAPTFEG